MPPAAPALFWFALSSCAKECNALHAASCTPSLPLYSLIEVQTASKLPASPANLLLSKSNGDSPSKTAQPSSCTAGESRFFFISRTTSTKEVVLNVMSASRSPEHLTQPEGSIQ